ncbi:MAG: hypothetical protein ABI451_11415 [Dokdonella sp.]
MFNAYRHRRVSRFFLSAVFLSCLSVCGFASAEPVKKPSFEAALTEARHPLVLAEDSVSGAGAEVLATAVAESRFVFVGEDHFSHEIPRLAVALCNLMRPDAYAVEAGPQAAEFVSANLRSPDRVDRLAARMRAHPNNMAFLDGREENDAAAQCAKASRNNAFAVWGLDQEFLGAAGVLLDAMVAAKPGPKSRAAIASLQSLDKAADAKARKSANPGDALLISATTSDLQPLGDALAIDGGPEAKRLFRELAASNTIYRLNTDGSPDSNRVRAELFKEHFLAEYQTLKKSNPAPRVLFKFGDNHAGKGFSPLHVRDIGNFVAELADGEKAKSLHIMVLGARGEHGTFGGYAKPTGKEAFAIVNYPEFEWLKPAVNALLAKALASEGTTLTLFDLRALRFRGIDLPSEWKRIVYSYDLFILIPEITAASTVGN